MVEDIASELKAKVLQTHTSWVLVLEHVVYKIKKPVNFGFLDYSTLEKRLENCTREMELNRRLCPWVYLDVIPISFVDGKYLLEDPTNPVEYAVKMRRIPEERLLKNILGTVKEEEIKKLSRHIANFHLRAERRDEFGKLEVMKFNTEENFVQTEKYIGITIDAEDYQFIRDKVNGFYEKYSGLFEKRIREGRIRDGHGDIRLEHVAFLDEGICVFDCIEFNERFRCGDMLNDMCFLSMEMDFVGREDLSEVYEEEYVKMTKDEEYEIFLPFFKCYRAYVRGKVNSFLLDDPNYTDKEKAREIAKRLFQLSRKYAEKIP
ncbi:MAG: gluconokinase [Aquificaceae bacterium]|nr:gluconokinase [Aquificaceae bacterium]MCS7277426.1 gluconokinase [Aquificaceae bacterium]MDW8422823.1 gluconokinase [Aquificaceae bacterium]